MANVASLQEELEVLVVTIVLALCLMCLFMVLQQLREQCHADQRQLTMAAEIGQQLLAENTEVKSQIACFSDKVDRANESKKQLEEEVRTSTKNAAETQERYQKVGPLCFQYKTYLHIKPPWGWVF